MRSDASTRRHLEPGFLFDDVDLIELLIGFRQVNDPFDEADEAAHAQAIQEDHDDSAGRISQHEFVDAKPTNQNCDDPASNPARTFFFSHGNPFAKVVNSSRLKRTW